MIRVAMIAAAIGMLQPHMPEERRTRFAEMVHSAAGKHHDEVDPFLIVAYVDEESEWRPGAINPKSGAAGLGQILPSTRSACRKDRTSDACVAEKTALLDPGYNLRLVAAAMKLWRRTCNRETGRRSTAVTALAGMAGLSRPPKQWCNHRLVRVRGRLRWQEAPMPAPVRTILRRYRRIVAACSSGATSKCRSTRSPRPS